MATSNAWSVVLRTAAGAETTLSDAVLGVSIEPEHTALWDGEVKLAPVIDPDDYRFGEMDILSDGAVELRCAIEHTADATDGTLTVGGRERVGLRLTDETIERVFDDQSVPSAIRSVWRGDTDFDATVHDPPARRVTDYLAQEAHSARAFSDLLTSRPRDDQGRFVATETGSAPDFLPTEPVHVTATGDPGGVELLQTAWTREGENWDGQTRASTLADDTASANETAVLDQKSSAVSFGFHSDYDIPAGEFLVTARMQASFDASQYPGDRLEYYLDGELFGSLLLIKHTVFIGADWGYVTSPRHQHELSAGDHTVELVKTNDAASLNVDVVAPLDARFSYTLDNNLTNGERVVGPELYPEDYTIDFAALDPGLPVDTVTVDAEFSRVGGHTAVSVHTPDGTQTQSVDATSTTTTFSIDDPTARVSIGPQIERQANDPTRTPATGFETSRLTDIEVRVSGDEIPWLTHAEIEGSIFDVLKKLHQRGGYGWAIDHGRADGRAVVESFERGDPTMARDLPPDAILTDVSQKTDTEGYRNRVTVIGQERPPALRRDGEPRHFRATVEDTDEIADNGVQAIEINDSDAATDSDARSEARTELRKHSSADTQGGKTDTTPALVEPGYPYRVPALSSDRPYGPKLGSIAAIDWSDFETLKDVAAGAAVTIDSQRVTRDTTIAGSVTIAATGALYVRPYDSFTVADGGSLTVENGGRFVALDPPDLAGSVTIGPGSRWGDYAEVWADVTIVDDLTIADGGRVHVLGSGSLTESAGGSITVETGGEITDGESPLPARTLETWSLSESPGSASSSGTFERIGGLGGRDDAALLGLLAGD